MEEFIAMLIFFGTIFGISYVYLTTRNKERLALIEKGADASLFERKSRSFSIAKFILNVALLLIGIGIGIFLGEYIHQATDIYQEIAIPSMLFIFGGLGLVAGFFVTRKLEKDE